ncbi:MAG TPA: hypothetical protein VIW24_05700 [Aldersonia sp.]
MGGVNDRKMGRGGSAASATASAGAGHIASLVNPATNKKASNRIGPVDRDVTPPEWMDGIEVTAGSWWPDHLQWLTGRSGEEIAAPNAPGAPGFEPVAPAHGTYIRES